MKLWKHNALENLFMMYQKELDTLNVIDKTIVYTQKSVYALKKSTSHNKELPQNIGPAQRDSAFSKHS